MGRELGALACIGSGAADFLKTIQAQATEVRARALRTRPQ